MVTLNDFENQFVLVTGGTQGIGLSTAKEFAKQGAQVAITYKFGSADIDSIQEEFEKLNYKKPIVYQSDVGNDEDIAELLADIKSKYDKIDVFVSNVAFGALTSTLEDYSDKDLFSSIRYSTWPLFGITLAIKEQFDAYPRYAVGVTSFGSEQYLLNYDLLGTCKAMMEAMIRYFNYHLFNEDIRVNLVKPQFVDTDSLSMTMGKDFAEFAKSYSTQGLITEAKLVADAIFILCSGLMDGVRGQTLKLDAGSAFADNVMRYYEERSKFDM